MGVTIKDVAKRANVAPSTVSRVISDSPKISEATKRKVRKAMDELGYHLNFNARVLVQKSTKTIGIVMKNSASQSLHNPFFPEVLRGISAVCQKQDYNISLTTGETEEAIFEDTVKMVQGKRVDGMIVLYSKQNDKVVPYLMEANIPFVVIGRPINDASQIMHVDNNNVQAGKDATEYLINLDHHRIGFISGDPEYQVIKDRLDGYKDALRSSEIDFNEEYCKGLTLEDMKEKQVVEELLALPKPPTALVITDDIFALSIMLALRENRIKVPEDMSVISFNNTMISRYSAPPMTSVDTQTYYIGYEGAKCLLELIAEPTMLKKSVVVPTLIVKRDSCNEHTKRPTS